MAEQLGKFNPKVSPLPYITVPTTKGNIKFLIDCGANVKLISSKWANNSGKTIHNITTETVQDVTGKDEISKIIKSDIFQPILQESFEFLIYDFHPFFDE